LRPLGKFGQLWSYIRNIECVTPEAYIEILYKVFGGSKKDRRRAINDLPHAPLRSNADVEPARFDVKEVFYLTDYKALFKDCDKDFMSGYTKNENTQLAWKMEAVTRGVNYPLGVRTMYKVRDIYSIDG
jgi:hypothetical protein